MKTTKARVLLCAALIWLIAGFTVNPGRAQQTTRAGYITGVVQGAQGPEAGVWVIAETKDLLTNFIKIVVTNDQGRFMLPELPDANYKVWVRGYGLIDSAPIEMKPSTTRVTLKAIAASGPYPARSRGANQLARAAKTMTFSSLDWSFPSDST